MSHRSPGKTVAHPLELLGLEKADISALAVYSATVGVFYLALPLAAQALFANVAFGTLMQPVVVLAAIVFAVLTVLSLLENIVVERLQRRYFARLALSFAESLSNSEAGTIDRAPALIVRTGFSRWSTCRRPRTRCCSTAWRSCSRCSSAWPCSPSIIRCCWPLTFA